MQESKSRAYLAIILCVISVMLAIVSLPAKTNASDDRNRYFALPIGLRVGSVRGLSIGSLIGVKRQNFVMGFLIDTIHTGGWSSIHGYEHLLGCYLGFEMRHAFDTVNNFWLGGGVGSVFDIEQKYLTYGPYIKFALGSYPWGKRKSFGPYISGSYNRWLVSFYEGDVRSSPSGGCLLPNKCTLNAGALAIGLEWQIGKYAPPPKLEN